MQFLKNLEGKKITRVIYLILDILCINLSSFFAVFLRFNLQWESVEIWYMDSIVRAALLNTIVTLLIFLICRLYRSLWRFAGETELFYIIIACLASDFYNLAYYVVSGEVMFKSYFILYGGLLFASVFVVRFGYRMLCIGVRNDLKGKTVRNIMIVGAGAAGNMVIKELQITNELDARVLCLIDDDPLKKGTYIHGVQVVGNRNDIEAAAEKYKIDEIIFAIPTAPKKEQAAILEICQRVKNCRLQILPGIYQLVSGEVTVSKLRHVEIEDLLGRDPIQVTNEKVGRYVSGKVVLVTGGGGSIGSELCRQIAANAPKQLIIFDIYENNAYEIQQELKRTYPNLDLVVLIGSVRNGRRLNSVFEKYRPNIVYHAAAHKHVPLMEDSPNEAIKNNVFGTYKTALAADRYGAERFVLISTDKAVNPTNIMGASKRICEMVIQTFAHRSTTTNYVAVRFGNVLGSNGSVIPLFKKQIEEGGPVTVTHPDIVRYFMTIPEAVSLVLQAGASAKGGEIFVLDMGKPVKIVDLARNLIRLSGLKEGVDIDIKFTGLRPGEKLYEELLMNEEGLKNTDNDLIHIGRPLEFDEEEFLEELKDLYVAAYAEGSDMKQIVSTIVPTYHIREEDIVRDQQIAEEWKGEFPDTGTTLPYVFLEDTREKKE